MSAEWSDELDELTEAELDARLSQTDDEQLGPQLRLLLQPPADLTERVSQRVADSMLTEDLAMTITSLLGLGFTTEAYLLGLTPEEPDDE